jgi:TonB family protein
MSAHSISISQPKDNSFPFMLMMSIAAHVVGILLIIVAPQFFDYGREPFGGPSGGGGLNVVTVDFNKGITGRPARSVKETTPAPPKEIAKLTKPDEVELESELTIPDPDVKKKSEKEPTEKQTLNQPERKREGPFGTGTDTSKEAGRSGNQGSGQFGLGTFGAGGIGEGGYGTGTGKPFPFPWYIENVLTKIELNWVRPYIQETTPQEYAAVVYFVITKAGQVRQVKVERSSGISALDRSSESAVMNSAPFPPLPVQWVEPDLAFRVTFSYRR